MKPRNRGFTWIELLVVILIIVLMIAILFPAVQSGGHGSARRQQCKHNLKMLGLALHNYHEMANSLPPGWVSSNLYGWNALLLPFLDQEPLYKQLNFQRAWTADSLNAAWVLPMLRCPTDKGVLTVGTPVLSVLAGRSSYPGISGATPITSQTIDVTETRGTFGENSRRNSKQFSDGLSNCIIVGERVTSGGPDTNPGGDTLWIGVRDNKTQQGQALAVGECAATNPPNIKPTPATRASGSHLTGFSSLHIGGAHFLMGDGSVRFITENVNVQTYANLATIDDGQELGDY